MASQSIDPLRRLFLGAPLIVVSMSVACSRQTAQRVVPTATPVRVRMAVDGAALPLVRMLTQVWQHTHSAWFFAIDSGNSSVINQLVVASDVDLAVVAQLPDDASFWSTDLAIDGVAVIVNAANPVRDLSLAEVREIFAGYRRDWSMVQDAARGTVQVVVREYGEGTQMVFDRQVMGETPCSASAVVMPTAETVINYVALHPEAIAYIASGRFDPVQQTAVRAVALDGNVLSAESLLDGTYPLSRNLHVIARQQPTGELRDFLIWMRSDEARQIAESMGYAVEP